MMRLKPSHKGVSLGTVLDIDGTKYEVSEIQFKTPSDHKIKGQGFAMEVQIIHEAVAGDYKKSLILAVLYQKKAGAKLPFFNHLDILSLPNINNKETECFLGENFSVHMFT
jgi:carbonic anhydrase